MRSNKTVVSYQKIRKKKKEKKNAKKERKRNVLPILEKCIKFREEKRNGISEKKKPRINMFSPLSYISGPFKFSTQNGYLGYYSLDGSEVITVGFVDVLDASEVLSRPT